MASQRMIPESWLGQYLDNIRAVPGKVTTELAVTPGTGEGRMWMPSGHKNNKPRFDSTSEYGSYVKPLRGARTGGIVSISTPHALLDTAVP